MSDQSLSGRLRGLGLLPHQVDFAELVLNAPLPLRVLLTSLPGMGKSVAIAASLGELAVSKGSRFRCLVVAPAALQWSWQALLQRYGSLDARIINVQEYRRVAATTPPDINPWNTTACVVTSLDFLKTVSRLAEVIGARWDAVVLDEAHLCTVESQRGNAGRAIWDSQDVGVALAATSLDGQPAWLAHSSTTHRVTWSRHNIRTWAGESIYPARRFDLVTFGFSAEERLLAEELRGVVARLSHKGSAASFLSGILYRRWASSIYAIEQSLRRYVASSVDARGPELDAPDEWLAGDPDSAGADIPLERADCQLLLNLLEQIPRDSKWAACKGLLESFVGTARAPITVFTEFADTAEYIGQLVQGAGWPAYVLNGRIPVQERWALVDQAREADVAVIVATVVPEGPSRWVSEHAIHFDLPMTAERLIQRCWGVEKVGSPFPVVHHHFLVSEGSAEHNMLSRLLLRVTELEHESSA